LYAVGGGVGSVGFVYGGAKLHAARLATATLARRARALRPYAFDDLER
jgi:hypothetical protein